MKKKWAASASAVVIGSLLLSGCGQAKPAATANNGTPQLPSGTNSNLGPDNYIGFLSGGISGSAEVIGIPSLRTLKVIPVGVDTHEP